MLIINADDYGGSETATRNTLLAYDSSGITSTSAMMFMSDSERSAELAMKTGLAVGLHLNLTERFTGKTSSPLLHDYHQQIGSFLKGGRYRLILYNPLLRKQFDYVFKAQYEEYLRIYRKEPTHIDGHHHMHLCTNMLLDRVIPKGMNVRRNFSFASGEKSAFNRFYRYITDKWVTWRYNSADIFFSITPIDKPGRLERIVNLSKTSIVELMVHPGRDNELKYILSDQYMDIIDGAQKGTYLDIKNKFA